MPDFDAGHLADNRHVWALEVTEEVEYLYRFFKTPVHFLPGGSATPNHHGDTRCI